MQESRSRVFRASFASLAAVLLVGPTSFALDLGVLGVEVTQALQHFNVANPGSPSNNSNVLVEGNHTAARIYVTVNNSVSAVAGVSATLSVFVNGSLHSVIAPDNGSITAPLLPDPDNEDDSLNFTLPLDLAEGDVVDLEVTIDPANTIVEDNEGNNTATLNGVSFQCRETPEIVYSIINYNPPDEPDPTTLGQPDPALIAAGSGDSFVFGIYPFPDDHSKYHLGPFPPFNWNQNIDTSTVDFLNALEDCRQDINPVPKFLYGWFKENPYSGNGAAISAPGNVAFGNTQTSPNRFQRTFAHELGHLFGLNHNTRDVAPETGFDVEDLLGLGKVKDGTKKDIMYAGLLTPQAWVDDTTYEYFMGHACLECTGDSGGLITTPYLTGGLGRIPGRVRLNAAFEFPRNGVMPTESASNPTVFVQALNSAGQVIERIGLAPSFENEEGQALEEVPFAVTFSTREPIQSIQVVEGENISARVVRSPNAPQVTILSPSPGAVLKGKVEVVWIGRDADLDTLVYAAQYSPGFDREGRQIWAPLAIRQRGTRVAVDTRYLAASKNGRIRVLASDGLNTRWAEVGGLVVPNTNPPTVAIVEPQAGRGFQQGSMVLLKSAVNDREDGILEHQRVTWSSDRDGQLGSGRNLSTASLSPGWHRITASAMDTDGHVTEQEILIEIRRSRIGRLVHNLVRNATTP